MKPKYPLRKSDAAVALFGSLLVMTLTHGCASSQGAKVVTKREMPDLAMPSSGKAKLVFFRPDSNSGIDIGVHDGEQLVAKLPGKTYAVYECAPGQHLFSGSFGNLDMVNANLLPDRIYYVKAGLVVQMIGPAWVKLVPIKSQTAEWQEMSKTLPKLEKKIVTPEESEHDVKGIARYMERLKFYQNKPGAVFETIQPEYGQSAPLYP